jgi:hypothetical protein
MSRIDNLKLQNKKYDISLIDSLSIIDPSDRYTYSEFLLKQIKEKISGNNTEFNNKVKDWRRDLESWYSLPSDNIENMSNLDILFISAMLNVFFNYNDIKILSKFEQERKLGKLDSIDITNINNFTEMSNILSVVDLKNIDRNLKKQVIKHYEDDEWLIVLPLTHLSSRKYGANTKWCTTAESYESFERYSTKGLLIYTINKKNGNKIATFYSLRIDDRELSFWDVEDRRIDSMETDLPDNIMKEIRSIIKNYKKSNVDFLSKEDLEKELGYYNSFKNDLNLHRLEVPVAMETVQRAYPVAMETVQLA